MITAILPVSRVNYLDRVLKSLDNQTLKPDKLIIIYEGVDPNTITLNYEVTLNHTAIISNNEKVESNIIARRTNIANIHNQVKDLIDTEWVFSIEDDGILPSNALERLTKSMGDGVGLVSGVELGRWGQPYVGAWLADDVFETKELKSLERSKGVKEIDASGLYCALIRASEYKQHDFYCNNGLGPDVNLGLFLRQRGYKNYIDWKVGVTHLTNFKGLDIEIPASDNTRVVTQTHLGKDVWQLT